MNFEIRIWKFLIRLFLKELKIKIKNYEVFDNSLDSWILSSMWVYFLIVDSFFQHFQQIQNISNFNLKYISNGSWTVYRQPIYRHPVYRQPVYRQPVYRHDRFIDSQFIDRPFYRHPVYRQTILSSPSLIIIFLYKFIKFTRDFDLIRPNLT